MKRVPINKIKNLTKPNHPLNHKTAIEEAYKIEISEHTVASDTSPYQLKAIIRYSDKTFKKRIKNICRESKIIIDFQQNHENTGSLFKPKYEWVTSVSIKSQLINDKMVIYNYKTYKEKGYIGGSFSIYLKINSGMET